MRQAVGIFIIILGLVGIVIAMIVENPIVTFICMLIAVAGVLFPVLIRGPREEGEGHAEHERLPEREALNAPLEALTELQRILSQTNLPDYKAGAKEYVAKGDYAAAIGLASAEGDDWEAAERLIFRAELFKANSQFEEAEEALLRALKIYKRLAGKDPDRYEPELAATLDNLGRFYGYGEQAEHYFLKALAIQRSLAEAELDTYRSDLAITLDHLGSLYFNRDEFEKGGKFLEEALAINSDLADKSDSFRPNLANSLNNMGNVYTMKEDFDRAGECYDKALAIRKELATENPQAFAPALAVSLKSLGNYYANIQEYADAEEYYKQCLATYRSLAAAHPQTFSPYLAGILVSMAIFYQDDYPKRSLSIRLAKEALKILDSFNNAAEREKAMLVLSDWETDN
ncbi:MAG: tetratricopeptide repeat protein [Tannerellaceae bacterium]|jgi:tetratricopeptide (TPR) repeat protein|nr:tetratricopeptide repeat protein [Tannerellaceae bacterium]